MVVKKDTEDKVGDYSVEPSPPNGNPKGKGMGSFSYRLFTGA